MARPKNTTRKPINKPVEQTGLLAQTVDQEVPEVAIEQKEIIKEEKQRPMGKRTPLLEQKATGVKNRPGFVARQIVEKPGRLASFLEAGYTIVPSDRLDNDGRIQTARSDGSVSREVVNKHRLAPGDASTAVWVEIKEEWYNEDQEAKLQRSREREAEIDPRNFAASRPKEYYGGRFDTDFDGF